MSSLGRKEYPKDVCFKLLAGCLESTIPEEELVETGWRSL
jgi:hypothetical protein